MRHSLRIKNTVILILLLFFLIFLCWFLNETFLEKYYQNKKVNYLSNSYNELNQTFSELGETFNIDDPSDGGIDQYDYSSELINRIERIEASRNVNIYIISEISSSYFFGRTVLSFIYPLQIEMGDNGDRVIVKNDSYNRIGHALQQYIFKNKNDNRSNSDLLTSKEDCFDVYKTFDPDVDSFYIDLVGYLDNGYLVFIRSNFENIQESADISSQFLAIVGLAVIVIGSIIMFAVSKSFTKPILELSNISDKMASLDFDSKYDGKRKDEIGRLGNSINILSGKLEHTITDLKNANIELERDIAHKIEIDEMRKEFLSNVSHELKTPIALIQGYAEGLQDNINEDDPESRAFYCDVIIDEAQKMNNLVRKLTTLNEIEFGANKLDLERFDIVELTRSVSNSIDILAKSKDINVVFNEHEPIYVWGDAGMIEQVVTNYLSNAINHIDGRRVIDVSFAVKEDDKVRVSIFNTGENIPDDELENIWVKFYKVDKARTREYGGSGIGLSIVKAIMDQHNQAYGATNHPAGVEFWFEMDMKSDN